MKFRTRAEIMDILWERNKNPWTFLTRVMIGYAFLLALWHHEWTWMLLLTLALITSPFWFPRPADTRHFLSRAVEGERIWLERAGMAQKRAFNAFGVILLIALVWALWTNRLFPALGLVAFVTFYKGVFLWWMAQIAQANEPPENGGAES